MFCRLVIYFFQAIICTFTLVSTFNVNGVWESFDGRRLHKRFFKSGRTLLLTDGVIVSIGVIVLIENVVALLALYRCSRLLFQIRILSLNLAVTDFLTGFVLALPNSIIYDKYLCDIKQFPSFIFINASLLIITITNIDRYFCLCLRNEILFVHHKEIDDRSKCLSLDA